VVAVGVVVATRVGAVMAALAVAVAVVVATTVVPHRRVSTATHEASRTGRCSSTTNNPAMGVEARRGPVTGGGAPWRATRAQPGAPSPPTGASRSDRERAYSTGRPVHARRPTNST